MTQEEIDAILSEDSRSSVVVETVTLEEDSPMEGGMFDITVDLIVIGNG